ncbi:molecular chaperone DnaK [Streptomyces sp. SBST2-5]|uniref:Molecular chaperone DnaK n=1 Tax=Streptomyces composti TaxID=2720025 RepID=A0ABX1A6I0_9ACTN|nr:TraR/DksA C4-type zinc finger protein [Streptomyces composti]NJP52055.1 molecular chaperone DnaK [Streptomyces composti]
MSLDVPRTEPRPGSSATEEIRRRLEHARSTRLAQLKALDEESASPDDPLTARQREAIQSALQEIEQALARLDDGTYGICEGCGKPVPPERLEILPYTRHCVTCRRRAA